MTEADVAFDESGEPKTGPRSVPIPRPLVDLLRSWTGERGLSGDDLLFRTRSGARPTSSSWSRALQRGLRAIEHPPMRIYDCRHAAATTWLRAGVPLGEVAKRMGHSVETLVSTYVGALDGDEVVANERIDAVLDPDNESAPTASPVERGEAEWGLTATSMPGTRCTVVETVSWIVSDRKEAPVTAQVRRSVPSRLAGVLEALELEQPRVVTAADLDLLARDSALTLSGVELGYQLRRLGWLLPLRTRGVWEFAPAARAGRLSAGDRHIELRAALAIDPEFPGVLAMESAAVLLGLAGHVPEREVLAVPQGFRVSPALRDWRVIQIDLPEDASAQIEGLPVWRVEALLAGMAIRPAGYHDWANAAAWLPRAVEHADLAVVRSLLDGAPTTAHRRAGYLLAVGGRGDEGLSLVGGLAADRGPVYLGPRSRPGRFDARFGVLDSVLAAGLESVDP